MIAQATKHCVTWLVFGQSHSCLAFLSPFSTKVEKEKKKMAQDAGMIRSEVTGGEVNA